MTRIQETLESYDAAFHDAQRNFDSNLDETDHSGLILPGDTESFDNERRKGEKNAEKNESDAFIPIDLHLGSLAVTDALYLNRVLLIQDRQQGTYSPVVITKKMDHHPEPGQIAQSEYFMTKIIQPFVPEVGVTTGMHFGVSLATQTRSGEFGGHGPEGKASGFEQGHFLAVVLGAHEMSVGQEIASNGHSASGKVINSGIADQMSGGVLIDIPKHRTVKLDTSSDRTIQLYWHKELEQEDMPVIGNFAEATKLLAGGALKKLGETGQERVKLLVDDAIKEKTSNGNHHEQT